MRITDFTDSMSDDELLSSAKASRSDETTAIAAMIVYLVAIEERRLHLEEACSSRLVRSADSGVASRCHGSREVRPDDA
jgi:hypothetical protein